MLFCSISFFALNAKENGQVQQNDKNTANIQCANSSTKVDETTVRQDNLPCNLEPQSKDIEKSIERNSVDTKP